MLNRKLDEYNTIVIEKRHEKKVCHQINHENPSLLRRDEVALQKGQCLFLGLMEGRHLKLAIKVDDVRIKRTK